MPKLVVTCGASHPDRKIYIKKLPICSFDLSLQVSHMSYVWEKSCKTEIF